MVKRHRCPDDALYYMRTVKRDIILNLSKHWMVFGLRTNFKVLFLLNWFNTSIYKDRKVRIMTYYSLVCFVNKRKITLKDDNKKQLERKLERERKNLKEVVSCK